MVSGLILSGSATARMLRLFAIKPRRSYRAMGARWVTALTVLFVGLDSTGTRGDS